MIKVLFCFFLVLQISFLGCSKEQQIDRDVVYHPTEKNIPRNIDNIILKQEVRSSTEFGFLKRLEENYISALLVGDDSENDSELLGEIEDIVITNDNNLLVLDSRQNKIKIYDLNGKLIHTFGKSGRGPGEFISPESMILSMNNQLFISDRYNKINVYLYEKGIISYRDTIILNFVPEDMCTLGGFLIIRGIKQNDSGGYLGASILHVYSIESLKHVKSFGDAYKSENPLIVNQLSDGPIACDENTNSIIMMYEYLPFLYSYSLDGRYNWISRIDGFDALTIVERFKGNRPSVSFTSKEDGSETGISMKSIYDNIVVLQTRKMINEEYIYLTYAFTADSGRGVYLGNNIPVIYTQENEYLAIDGPSEYPDFELLKIK